MAQTAIREIERKYELPAGVAVPTLDDLPGVAVDPAADVFRLEAVYFDTADLRLASHRITLRRRTGGDDAGWHLKLPAGPDGRDEIHWPLGRSSRTVPAELASLVTAYARGSKLEPVARIRTTRTRRRLRDDAGEVLAELVADDVAGEALGREVTVSSWSEIEVELAGGERELLDRVERRLRRAGVRRSAHVSKLARVLGDRLETDRTPRRKRSSVGTVVVDHLSEQVETLLAYDPRVRRDEPDSIHKMRVATRRLRSALQTFGTVVERESTRPLTDELKWLAGVLGEARDLEVLRERFESEVAATPDELVVGPIKARITAHLAHQQAEAREHVLEALGSRRYFDLLDALDALVDAPPLTGDSRRPAGKALPRTLLKNHRRVSRQVSAASGLGPGEDRDVALHEARKAAKRARYAGELAQPALGKTAKRFAKDMEDVQEELGAHQDSVVARGVLREIGMQAHLAGENGFTFGLLYGTEKERADNIEARIPAVRKAVKAARRRLN
ncbi:CYTH and CHAD domain-containing protein [Cryptosporangium phraense]|uniref:CYTH and CHAD domain-containing protein n=1 Tax=Cryptosporangium phraense TaxID=2593070 RepID=A0A545AHP5_9ACTN|nr:CYTH and CHAD domain-containing protein [Cryptosporangium phraense]TQS40844.1 CYTH and CHAD domain-containing protein [Cryptosporangium phraense]